MSEMEVSVPPGKPYCHQRHRSPGSHGRNGARRHDKPVEPVRISIDGQVAGIAGAGFDLAVEEGYLAGIETERIRVWVVVVGLLLRTHSHDRKVKKTGEGKLSFVSRCRIAAGKTRQQGLVTWSVERRDILLEMCACVSVA